MKLPILATDPVHCGGGPSEIALSFEEHDLHKSVCLLKTIGDPYIHLEKSLHTSKDDLQAVAQKKHVYTRRQT